MTRIHPWALALLLSTTACSGTEEPPGSPAAEVPAEAPALELSKEDLQKGAENIALVPSPVETQRALEAAGIDAKLSDKITPRDLDLKNADLDNAAVRTGVLVADMLLTVKSAEDEQLISRLEQIKTGMQQLGGGKDIEATISDIQERIKGQAVTRDELLKELDELSGAVIPELEFNGQDRVVPLIQAGSWLEGANLVAKAVKDAGKPDAASNLLKQPAVVDYFIGYVKTEGQEKAPAAVTQKLEESLNTLKGVSTKEGDLTAEDIDVVIQTTDDVLALL